MSKIVGYIKYLFHFMDFVTYANRLFSKYTQCFQSFFR